MFESTFFPLEKGVAVLSALLTRMWMCFLFEGHTDKAEQKVLFVPWFSYPPPRRHEGEIAFHAVSLHLGPPDSLPAVFKSNQAGPARWDLIGHVRQAGGENIHTLVCRPHGDSCARSLLRINPGVYLPPHASSPLSNQPSHLSLRTGIWPPSPPPPSFPGEM